MGGPLREPSRASPGQGSVGFPGVNVPVYAEWDLQVVGERERRIRPAGEEGGHPGGWGMGRNLAEAGQLVDDRSFSISSGFVGGVWQPVCAAVTARNSTPKTLRGVCPLWAAGDVAA